MFFWRSLLNCHLSYDIFNHVIWPRAAPCYMFVIWFLWFFKYLILLSKRWYVQLEYNTRNWCCTLWTNTTSEPMSKAAPSWSSRILSFWKPRVTLWFIQRKQTEPCGEKCFYSRIDLQFCGICTSLEEAVSIFWYLILLSIALSLSKPLFW